MMHVNYQNNPTMTSNSVIDIGKLSKTKLKWVKQRELQLIGLPRNYFNHQHFSILTTPPPIDDSIFPIALQEKSSKGWGQISAIVGEAIPEDSIFRKLLACIPVLGIIPTVVNERSLGEKITKANSSSYVAKLINVKNHYKISSIVREVLSVALIVHGISLSFFSAPVGIGAGIVVGGCALFNAYAIYQNKKIISKLQIDGISSPGICAR